MAARLGSPKIRLGAVLAATSLLALAACGSDDSPAGSSGTAGGDAPAKPVKVTVAMNWITPSAGADFYMMADEKGYYKDAGLDVEWKWLKGSNLAAQAVGVGQVDFADVDASAILIALSQKIPMTVIAAPMQNTPMGVVTLKDNNITSIDDLKGKTVSTALAGPDAAVLQALLEQKGIEKDVKLSYVESTAKCTVMVAGDSQACTGQNTGHVGQVESASGKAALFIPFSTDAQPLPGTSIVANNDFLKKNPDVVKKFLEATFRGVKDAGADEKGSISMMERLRKDAGGSPADVAGIASGVTNAHTLWHSAFTDKSGWGWVDPDAWSTLQDMLVSGEIMKSKVDVSTIYSNDYLPPDSTTF
jgi:NitT/TauT family transport system substrate-binding protein